MWSKIYFIILGLSAAMMAFFTYYSSSWLESIGIPGAAAAGYDYHSNLAWPALWISAAVLLLLGNAVLWNNGKAWAVWTTFAYFAVAVAIRYFWLEPASTAFRRMHGLADGGFSAGPFFAVILIVVMAIAVFVDQFLVIRMRAKSYPTPTVDADIDSVDQSAINRNKKTPGSN